MVLKTAEDRMADLRRLREDMAPLVAALPGNSMYSEYTGIYREAMARIEVLLAAGFGRDELRALLDGIPRILYCHPRWEPPLVEMDDGKLAYPDGYEEFERLYLKVMDDLEELRSIGHT